jgi:hypothetical protein
MKVLRYASVMCLIVAFKSYGMDDSVRFSIEEKFISVTENTRQLSLHVRITNNSNLNFILWSLRRSLVLSPRMYSNFFTYRIKNGGAGTAVVLLDHFGKNVNVMENSGACLDCDSTISHDAIERVRKKILDTYLQSTTIVYLQNTIRVEMTINLEKFILRKGEYKLFLIYYCADNIGQVVGQQIIDDYEGKFDAHTAKGWIRSDTIRLIVK